MSFKSWLSIITFVLVGVILFFTRHELVAAWHLLGQVNLWVLSLMVVVILVGYLANGEMIFSYLRGKNHIRSVPMTTLMRMSLELNFVNHVLPSGGVSGISYLTWRLGKFGVSHGRATMAQLVRYIVGFAAFIVLLAISVLVVTIDGNINRWIILISSTLVTAMVGITVMGMYLVQSPKRVHQFSKWLAHTANHLLYKLTRGRKRKLLDEEKICNFFTEMHDDYMEIIRDRRVLLKPLLWGILFTITEVMIFFIAFWALGSVVNPAPILIAYGVASLAGFVVVTPGGAGAYEAIMVFIMSLAGVAGGTAIAGILLTRVLLLVVTIGVGYFFYQNAINRYHKNDRPDTAADI